MKNLKTIWLLCCILTSSWLVGQNISINNDGSQPDGSAMLDVSSNTQGILIPRMTLTARNAITNPANSLLIYQTDNTPGYYFNSGTSAVPVWTQLSAAADNLGNHRATTNIQLATNYLSGDGDNEGIYIDNTGNIGLGTTTPSGKLDIVDNTETFSVNITNSTNSSSDKKGVFSTVTGGGLGDSYGIYGEANSATGDKFGVFGGAVGAGGTKYGLFGEASGAGTNWAGYFNDGNVYIDNLLGIGTLDPSAPLNVSRAVAPSETDGAFIDVQNDNGTLLTLSGIRFKNNTIDGNVRYNAAVFHRLNETSDYQLNFAVRLNATGNVDTSDIKMTINDNGQVGIGTTSPSSSLTVSNNTFTAIMNLESSFSNTLMDFDNSGINSASWSFGYLGNTGANPGFMTFLNGSHRLIITNNGDVGIGTTTPSSSLEVVGDVEIPAANDYTYSSPKTRYASIPPSAFVSVRPVSYELTGIGVLAYISIGGSSGTIGYAAAPINNIPNGARIVDITYVYYDNDNSEEASFAISRTSNLGTAFTSTGNFDTGVAAASTSYQTNTTNVGLTLDYENFYYSIYFTGIQGNSNLRLKNVVIEYTVTEAD